MRKVVIICVILGCVLLLCGIGIRLGVDSNSDVQSSNELIKILTGEDITPSLVSELINEGVIVFDNPITFDDVLLKLYVNSTFIMILGGLFIIFSLLVYFISKKKC